MTYSEEGGALKIWINGRRFIARGGNWGFGESMLRYRAREYDAAVRYHREMNFTMIRNWVGQIGDEAFYEACDQHGVVVWQDFWLANPWDGPEPDDNALFLSNVKDLVLRIRNHPSIGLYCGRNEGFPPPPLEEGIRKILGESASAACTTFPAPPTRWSADTAPTGRNAAPASTSTLRTRKLHSEIGVPNIPSHRERAPHDAGEARCGRRHSIGACTISVCKARRAAPASAASSKTATAAQTSAEEWISAGAVRKLRRLPRRCLKRKARYRMGVLLWMSHSCWPSFVWQTYDYYFEPTAAYFGCKKGSEPLHIQWNCADRNHRGGELQRGKGHGTEGAVEVLNMDGTRKDVKTAALDSAEDSTVTCIKMAYPAD